MTKEQQTRILIKRYRHAVKKDKPRYMEQLYKLHEGAITMFVARFVGPRRENFDDLFNEAVLTFMRAVKGFNLKQKVFFISYLGQAIRNESYKFFSNNKIIKTNSGSFKDLGEPRYVFLDKSLDNPRDRSFDNSKSREIIQLKDDKINVQSDVENNEEKEKIKELINKLDEPLRIVIYKNFYENKSHKEIATELGVTHQAVSARIQRGIYRLRNLAKNCDILLSREDRKEAAQYRKQTKFKLGEKVVISNPILFKNRDKDGLYGYIDTINNCDLMHKRSQNCYIVDLGYAHLHFEEAELKRYSPEDANSKNQNPPLIAKRIDNPISEVPDFISAIDESEKEEMLKIIPEEVIKEVEKTPPPKNVAPPFKVGDYIKYTCIYGFYGIVKEILDGGEYVVDFKEGGKITIPEKEMTLIARA
jgi:RNA polymerase sigma factor (sigma-70 family)